MHYLADRCCRKFVMASSTAAVGFQSTRFRSQMPFAPFPWRLKPHRPGVRIMNAAGPRAWVADPVDRILSNWRASEVDVSYSASKA